MPPIAELPATLAARLAEVRARIGAAAVRAGRDPLDVTLLPVTKGHPVTTVRAALELGLPELGENYVQECRAKQDGLGRGTGVRWHLLGHLQRNKARRAAELFSLIESVDRAEVAAALGDARDAGAPLPVLLEVELTGLPGRGGVAPGGLAKLGEEVLAIPGLLLRGLMTVAAPERPQAQFSRCRELRGELESALGQPLPVLSMGMSQDFEAAVAEGSTEVRLGTVLFGPRPPR